MSLAVAYGLGIVIWFYSLFIWCISAIKGTQGSLHRNVNTNNTSSKQNLNANVSKAKYILVPGFLHLSQRKYQNPLGRVYHDSRIRGFLASWANMEKGLWRQKVQGQFLYVISSPNMPIFTRCNNFSVTMQFYQSILVNMIFYFFLNAHQKKIRVVCLGFSPPQKKVLESITVKTVGKAGGVEKLPIDQAIQTSNIFTN